MSRSREEVREGIKKSKTILGPIYPVLVKKGTLQIIDGITRKQADPTWPEREVEAPDKRTEILLRMHANYRRPVSRKETQTELLLLANLLEEEGVPPEQIMSKLGEMTPYSPPWLRVLLPKKYKIQEMARPRIAKAQSQISEIRKISKESPSPQFSHQFSPPSAGVGDVEKNEAQLPMEETSKLKPPKKVTCPHCHTDLQKVLCSVCWRDLNVKDLLKEATG